VDGEMEKDDWGIVRINDPDLVFQSPLRLPKNDTDMLALIEQFRDQFYLRAEAGHSLYEAIKAIKFPFAVKRLWVKYWSFCSFESRLYLYLAWFVGNRPQ
jgi:hypothetical protein